MIQLFSLSPKRCYRGPFYGDPHDVPTWKNHSEAEVPEEYYKIPLGQGRLAMEGENCTVIAWGTMVHVSERAIIDSGISCDLIDLQTLLPWDKDIIIKSIKKTGRCVIVHEAPQNKWFRFRTFCFDPKCYAFTISKVQYKELRAGITPFPHTTEWDYMPSTSRIIGAIKKTQE